MIRLFTLALFVGSIASYACPDFGVELDTGDSPFKGTPVRVTGKSISLELGKGSYTIFWKGGLDDGKWCYTVPKVEGEKCLGNVKGNKEVDLKDGKDGGSVLLRVYQRSNQKLASTDQTGVFLGLLVKSKDGKYKMPWLRFAYSVETSPRSEETNDLDTYIKLLQKKRVSDKEIGQQTMSHRMYADLFENREAGGGIIDHPSVLGSLTVEKSEVPFAPVPRATLNSGAAKADISKSHWKSKKDGSGCHTDIEEVNP